jgi:PAS domain-containing protein
MHISEQNNPLVSHRINMSPPSKRVVILLDQRGIFDCNSTALAVLGFDRKEDVIGKHLYYFSPRYQPSGQGSVSLSLDYTLTALREGSCRFNWLFKRPIGTEFLAEVTLTSTEMHSRKTLRMNIRYIGDRQPSEFRVDLLGATNRLASRIADHDSDAENEFEPAPPDKFATDIVGNDVDPDNASNATSVNQPDNYDTAKQYSSSEGRTNRASAATDRSTDRSTDRFAPETDQLLEQSPQSDQFDAQIASDRQNLKRGNDTDSAIASPLDFADSSNADNLGTANDVDFSVTASEFEALEAFINEEIANVSDLDLAGFAELTATTEASIADLVDQDLGSQEPQTPANYTNYANNELNELNAAPAIPAPQPITPTDPAIANGNSASFVDAELPGFSTIGEISAPAIEHRNRDLLRQIGLALDSSSDPVCITSSKGEVIHLNQAFRNKFGYSLSQFAQADSVGIFHPPFIDTTVVNDIFKTIFNRNAWSGKVTVQSQSGQDLEVNLQINVVKDLESQLSGLICVFGSDRQSVKSSGAITAPSNNPQLIAPKATIAETEQVVDISNQIAQLKAQKLALESEIAGRMANQNSALQITTALESTSDAIGITDINGIATYTNRAFFELFGYSLQRLQKPGILRELFP